MSELSERVYIMEYKQRLNEQKQREKEKIKKEIKAIQHKKETDKEFKEYEKGLIIACKRELKDRFEIEFRNQGTNAKYYFYNAENRDAIIKTIAKSELEGDYLEDNYNKILNSVIKKYELNEEYNEQQRKLEALEYAEKMRPQLEKEAKQEKTKNILENLFLLIFGHPIILLFIIILNIFVWVFMGALNFSFFPAVGMSIIIIFVLIIGFLGFI